MNNLNSSVLEKIQSIKERAISLGASDIFLCSGAKPSCRVHGRTLFFEDEERFSTKFLEEYLHQIMGDQQKKKFWENFEMDFALSGGIDKKYRFRVNAFLQMTGISVVFRMIPDKIPSFEELGLPQQFRKIPDYKNGLVLVTGSMGSGKSTTLASILDLINHNYRKHILTVEDPIEFVHKNKKSLIEQREVGVHTHTFKGALRSCLRQGADVILVGELRDLESISLAITAAETGALVLATLHTNGSTKAINRLIDVFPGEQQNQIRSQLAESLRAVIWQSLLPKKNEEGRIAAFEVLFQNYAVSNLIREGKTHQLESIIETGQKEGMIPMQRTLKWLLQENEISRETAMRTLPEYASDF